MSRMTACLSTSNYRHLADQSFGGLETLKLDTAVNKSGRLDLICSNIILINKNIKYKKPICGLKSAKIV